MRHDWPKHHQHPLGRTGPLVGNCGGAFPARLHPLCQFAHRTDPFGGLDRGHVHGGDRDFRMVKYSNLTKDSEVREDGTKVYFLHGPLFFGSITDFNLGFTPAEDPESVVVDMKESRVWDHSGLEAIHKLGARYHCVGKTVKLQHISQNCKNLLAKAGSMVDVIVLPNDPSYQVANLNKAEEDS